MPRGLVLDLLDRRTRLADVRQQQRDAAAALGELQRRVDAARDRLHVVFDAQQEARDELAALRLARVEERRRRRLEAARDDLLDEVGRELLVAVGEAEGRHHDAVLEALEVALAVEGLERVARVVLERAEERLEAELLGVGEVVELLDELERVLRQHGRLVVLLLDEVVEALLERVEEHRVLVHVLQEVLPRRALVGVELDLAVLVVQVQHRVEGVVVHPLETRVRLERRLSRSLQLPPSFQSFAHAIHVFGRAEHFEPVQVRHGALAADDLSGDAEVLAEIRVSRGDDSADEARGSAHR